MDSAGPRRRIVLTLVVVVSLLGAGLAFASGGWVIVPSPSIGTGDTLSGVAAIASADVWAVGSYLPDRGGSQALVEHWNGSAWSIVPSPNGQFGGQLYGVSADSPRRRLGCRRYVLQRTYRRRTLERQCLDHRPESRRGRSDREQPDRRRCALACGCMGRRLFDQQPRPVSGASGALGRELVEYRSQPADQRWSWGFPEGLQHAGSTAKTLS